MIKLLLIFVLFYSCVPNIGVKHKGIEIPKKYDVDADVSVGPNFKEIKEYCDGKVLHEIEKTRREEDPDFNPDAEEIKYMQEDCYYGFDFSFDSQDYSDWLDNQQVAE